MYKYSFQCVHAVVIIQRLYGQDNINLFSDAILYFLINIKSDIKGYDGFKV